MLVDRGAGSTAAAHHSDVSTPGWQGTELSGGTFTGHDVSLSSRRIRVLCHRLAHALSIVGVERMSGMIWLSFRSTWQHLSNLKVTAQRDAAEDAKAATAQYQAGSSESCTSAAKGPASAQWLSGHHEDLQAFMSQEHYQCWCIDSVCSMSGTWWAVARAHQYGWGCVLATDEVSTTRFTVDVFRTASSMFLVP